MGVDREIEEKEKTNMMGALLEEEGLKKKVNSEERTPFEKALFGGV